MLCGSAGAKNKLRDEYRIRFTSRGDGDGESISLLFVRMRRRVGSQDDPSNKAVQHHQLHAAVGELASA